MSASKYSRMGGNTEVMLVETRVCYSETVVNFATFYKVLIIHTIYPVLFHTPTFYEVLIIHTIYPVLFHTQTQFMGLDSPTMVTTIPGMKDNL